MISTTNTCLTVSGRERVEMTESVGDVRGSVWFPRAGTGAEKRPPKQGPPIHFVSWVGAEKRPPILVLFCISVSELVGLARASCDCWETFGWLEHGRDRDPLFHAEPWSGGAAHTNEAQGSSHAAVLMEAKLGVHGAGGLCCNRPRYAISVAADVYKLGHVHLMPYHDMSAKLAIIITSSM